MPGPRQNDRQWFQSNVIFPAQVLRYLIGSIQTFIVSIILIIANSRELEKISRPEAAALFCGSTLPYYYQEQLWAFNPPYIPVQLQYTDLCADLCWMHTHTYKNVQTKTF